MRWAVAALTVDVVPDGTGVAGKAVGGTVAVGGAAVVGSGVLLASTVAAMTTAEVAAGVLETPVTDVTAVAGGATVEEGTTVAVPVGWQATSVTPRPRAASQPA